MEFDGIFEKFEKISVLDVIVERFEKILFEMFFGVKKILVKLVEFVIFNELEVKEFE